MVFVTNQPARPPLDADYFNARAAGRLPGLLGIEIVEVAPGLVRSRLDVGPLHLAPNGYLHAATVVGLADTACGYGTVANRPAEATGFTTIELKTNFLGTATEGAITCAARLAHGGRMTQVWDAEVVDERSGKVVALFRCTQMLLHPRG